MISGYRYISRVFILVQLFVCTALTLKCKCTQSSGTVKCVDGICIIDNEPSACLMLDHAVTGIHYACSQSDLPDGKCQQRTTKSGVVVNVCACSSDDFCNYKKWPTKTIEPELVSDRIITPITITANMASTIAPFFNIFIATIIFISYFYAFPRT